MGVRRYQQVASKALKTMTLQKNLWLKGYIPYTQWYDPETLVEMLKKYSSVYIKPDKGGGGGGIIRVKKVGINRYECSSLSKRKIVPLSQVPRVVRQRMYTHKRYIIQQGINLSTIRGRPFDIRVFLQRPKDQWEITGIAAKIAAPGKIVTNYCKGGRPFSAYQALLIICDNESEAKTLIDELRQVSLGIAKVLTRRFPGLRELGIDAGIDQDKKIWIFEVNTRPQFNMFKKLKNLGMYYKIKKNHSKII